MPVRAYDDHIRLAVRLTPRGGRDAIDGLGETPAGQALRARVSVPPEDGKANAALEKLVARWLGMPASAVSLVTGAKSRDKVLRIQGDPASLQDAVMRKLANCR